MHDVLVAEAERVGWPRIFTTDLMVHDRQALEWRFPPQGRFVWVLREHGTHIYFIEAATSRRVAEWNLNLMRYHQRYERCRWYIGDAGRRTLTPTTPEEAIRFHEEAQPPDQATGPAVTWQPDWTGLLYGAAD
jgi:hypothetical protein